MRIGMHNTSTDIGNCPLMATDDAGTMCRTAPMIGHYNVRIE